MYIRYFDADTIFGPAWKLRDLVSVWDAQLHLGYAHARDLSYLSIQEVVSVLMTPLGEDFRNRSSLIFVSLAIFFAFWRYLRVRFPQVPSALNAIAALFYAANPFVVAFIHDGYSGLLVDYALLPVSLLIVEWSRRANRPVIVSLVPLAFVVTGMYNLTSVFVSLLGVAVLEYEYLRTVFRSSRPAGIATALAFSLNVYWFVPLLYDLALHPKQPILAESGNDISALTGTGTLTNALLLRSYPEIWTKAYGVRECTGCAFYESPWFMLAMLFIVACAVIGLLRARRYGLMAALGASILIATGYRYQNEIIGVPYLILMGLPSFDAFRSSVKFSALTGAFYSIGLIYFYLGLRGRKAVLAILCSAAVVLVALPYILTGAVIERSPDNPPRFPNFVVSIPAYYAALKQNAKLLPDDTPTLLLPNMPLATYSWGAYGNDFLPPFLGKPTLAVNYLPQPSWQMEQILRKLTLPGTAADERRAIIRALGISSALYRDDVAGSTPLPQAQFGKQIAVFGAVHVLSNDGAFPLFASVQQIDPVSGVSGIATYAGLLHRAARGFDAARDGDAVCQGKIQAGIEPLPIHRKRARALEVPTNCPRPLPVSLVLANGSSTPHVIDMATNREMLTRPVPSNGMRLAQFTMPPGTHRFLLQGGPGSAAVLALVGTKISTDPYAIEAERPARTNTGFEFTALPRAHYTVFNQNFDPVWAGYVKSGGRWQPIHNFMADGFANAWQVPANSPLKIVNTLVVVTWAAAILGVVLLALYAYVFFRTWGVLLNG